MKLAHLNFLFLHTDLSTPISVNLLEKPQSHINKGAKIWFFNNAGVIEPISHVGKHSTEEIQNSIYANVISSVSIINFLLKNFNQNKIAFINISSGATK